MPNQGHDDCKTQDGNYVINMGVHTVLLHPIHTFDDPERSSGSKDMNISPNGGTGTVQVTCLSATLSHMNCHSG